MYYFDSYLDALARTPGKSPLAVETPAYRAFFAHRSFCEDLDLPGRGRSVAAKTTTALCDCPDV